MHVMHTLKIDKRIMIYCNSRVRLLYRASFRTILKAIFHFNRIVAKRSVFYCVHIIRFCLSVHEIMKYATFRCDTVEVENGLNN